MYACTWMASCYCTCGRWSRPAGRCWPPVEQCQTRRSDSCPGTGAEHTQQWFEFHRWEWWLLYGKAGGKPCSSFQWSLGDRLCWRISIAFSGRLGSSSCQWRLNIRQSHFQSTCFTALVSGFTFVLMWCTGFHHSSRSSRCRAGSFCPWSFHWSRWMWTEGCVLYPFTLVSFESWAGGCNLWAVVCARISVDFFLYPDTLVRVTLIRNSCGFIIFSWINTLSSLLVTKCPILQYMCTKSNFLHKCSFVPLCFQLQIQCSFVLWSTGIWVARILISCKSKLWWC